MTGLRRRDGQAGLTLVEVLVALALFSLIGLSGFSMLDTILRVRSGSEGRLDRQAQIDRALVVFTRDLQEADPTSLTQTPTGVTLNRTGTGIIAYVQEGGALLRRLPRSGFDQQMIGGVLSLRLRALDSTGIWRDAWPPEQQQSLGLAPRLRAIELALDLTEGTVIRLVDTPSVPPK